MMQKITTVPFIDLSRTEPGFHEALIQTFDSLVKAKQFIGGNPVAHLEDRLQKDLGVNYAISCANGTDALQLALRALDVGESDLVLVPNVTFWATFEAVVNVGARPVTIDVDPLDGGVCFEAFQKAIFERKPKAAVIAHLYGWGTAHLDDLRKLCLSRDVVLLEDGAQAFGVQYKNTSIFKDALISTTSFYPAKVLGAAGDGGAVFTNDPDLAHRVRRLSNHGRVSHYGYSDVGWNSRLDTLQAAYLNHSLDYISARIESRRMAVEFYQNRITHSSIQIMTPPSDYRENGYCNVCQIKDSRRKVALESTLKRANIGYANIYPEVMADQSGAKKFLNSHYGENYGKKFCSSVINLPVFPYITDAELHRVANVVNEFLENSDA
jgi:UDP-2-acetamido-2-deoxy-ribo-hexuluronate aminotransferase